LPAGVTAILAPPQLSAAPGQVPLLTCPACWPHALRAIPGQRK
jgi:hypothetical protein